MRMTRSDKGKKRDSYDMGLRLLKKQMRDLRNTLHIIKQDTRMRRTKKERRAAQREARLPKNRVCPKCTRVVVESRRWVVKDDVVVCRSCWKRYYE